MGSPKGVPASDRPSRRCLPLGRHFFGKLQATACQTSSQPLARVECVRWVVVSVAQNPTL